MNSIREQWRAVACLLWIAASPLSVLAHGDAEQPLYVAEGGRDVGDCLDVSRPCGTIAYALSRASKGSQVRVASGTFALDSAADVFHLVSDVVNVTGGYSPANRFGVRERGVTILTGVPYEYREILGDRGFDIVRDIKGENAVGAAEARKLLDLHASLKSSLAAEPCVGGSVAGLPCIDVDLLSHVGLLDISATPAGANDIWGFVDLNTGREYAIAGFNLGTAVFDVTDATNPREVGFVDGQNADWRDIKVYQFFNAIEARWNAYAYVTTDGSTDGLFVIDLTDLPHSISRTPYTSDMFRAHNVYATNTDYSTGITLTGDVPTLVIAGSNIDIGQYRAYELSNPESPAFVSGGTGIGYMHDASSLIITDARKDTQCAVAGPFCEILIDFNENAIEIWDVTDSAAPMRLSITPYANLGYTHSGWWSEDKMMLFVHDETDERDQGLATTVRVFSMADLTAPVLAGTWTGSTDAIDHNGFVRGNRYYMSNYSRGLTVLDITDPATPAEIGRLDTYPASDGTIFNGAWGTYPYFWSGNVAISDIDSGFYMAEDQTRDVAEGTLQFSSDSYAAAEGQLASLAVQRVGGTTGAVSVDFEVVHATADASDYTTATGTLNWVAGSGADQTIDLNIVSDGVAEPSERLLVRLVNPAGGATLGNLGTTSVWLGDPGAASEVSFLDTAASVSERGFATIIATIQRSGSAVGAVSVDIAAVSSADPGTDFTGTIPATINWADGDGNPKMVELLLIEDGEVEGDEIISLSLTNAVGATIGSNSSFNATILDAGGANVAPTAVAGANQTRPSGSSVTLNGSQSSDPDGDSLTFQWSQTSGPTVSLSNGTTASASFTAPNVTSDTILQFQLMVSDPGGLSDSATTMVTITASSNPPPAQNSGGGGGSTGLFFASIPFWSQSAPTNQSNGLRLIIVCSRSGPVEIISIGVPTKASIRAK